MKFRLYIDGSAPIKIEGLRTTRFGADAMLAVVYRPCCDGSAHRRFGDSAGRKEALAWIDELEPLDDEARAIVAEEALRPGKL